MSSQHREVFITGAGGMIGSHLLERLERESIKIIATYYTPTTELQDINTSSELLECDVRDANRLLTIIKTYLPNRIFHLAAQSYPVVSWEKPVETMEINSIGTINLFEAIKTVKRQYMGYDPIVVVACSSAEYGASLQSDEQVDEEAALLPLQPYGVSKVAQDLLAYQYFVNDQIRCVRARIFNTTGPRKKSDVVSDFAERIVAIEQGSERYLRVGNTDTKRSILDVLDLIDALLLLAEKGQAGEAYNICADQLYLISDLIKDFQALTEVKLLVQKQDALMRPSDESVIMGSNEKLKRATGWVPKITIKETLKRVLDYQRKIRHCERVRIKCSGSAVIQKSSLDGRRSCVATRGKSRNVNFINKPETLIPLCSIKATKK